MTISHKGAFAALLLLACAPAPLMAADPIPADSKLVPDSEIKTGTLPNGLRYAIVPHASPAGAVSLRLAVDVGSYDEGQDERGYAHYVEHMAFRSTRGAPTGVLDNRLASLGVALGKDHNAATSMVSTVYQVDLPGNDPKGVGEVMGWLRDTADGILFTPAATDAERGVVMAELRLGSGPLADVQRDSAHYLAGHLRSTQRDPIGTPEALESAKADGLRAFHRRWYRPDNALLVIAGAVEEAEARRLAEEHFGSWKANGPKPERVPAPGKFPDRATDAFVSTGPSLPQTVGACRLAPLDIARAPSMARLRTETLSAAWNYILGARLKRIGTQSGSPLLFGAAISSRDQPDARGTCLVVLPADGKWKEALAAAQAEMRRLAAGGPTQAEVEQAVNVMRWGISAEVPVTSSERKTADVANEIVSAHQSGRTLQDPVEKLAAFELAVAGLTPDDIKAAMAADWVGNGPLITATSRDPIDKEDLLAAWSANEKSAPLQAYADLEAIEWPYQTFGKAGKVAKKESVAQAGLLRFHYKNGSVLSFKQTDFSEGVVEIRVRFGHGVRALQAGERQPAGFAGALFPLGGLGRIGADKMEKAIGDSSWTFSLAAETDAWVMSSAVWNYKLDSQLKVLAAYMTDAAFAPVMDEKLPTIVDMAYGVAATEPTVAANDAIEQALFPDQKSYPAREEMLRFRAPEIARMLKPALSSGPVEITVVGDISEKEVRRAMARTFGALPARPPLAAPSGPGPFRHYPEVLPAALTGYHEGPADKAAAILTWPLYVASPARRREEHALQLLSSIFQNRLLQQVRVKMGKVYAPMVVSNMPDDADQGVMVAAIEGAPQDMDALVAAAREVAGELAAGKIDALELDRARKPLVAELPKHLQSNASWASTISIAYRHPDALRELTGFGEDMEAVTLDDVRKAAATWLARGPLVARGLPKAAQKQQAGAQAGGRPGSGR
jgi:zinc protease